MGYPCVECGRKLASDCKSCPNCGKDDAGACAEASHYSKKHKVNSNFDKWAEGK